MLRRLRRVSVCDSFDYSAPVAGRPSVISLSLFAIFFADLVRIGSYQERRDSRRRDHRTARGKTSTPTRSPRLPVERSPVGGAESRTLGRTYVSSDLMLWQALCAPLPHALHLFPFPLSSQRLPRLLWQDIRRKS